MKPSSTLPVLFIAGTLGGVLAPAPVSTMVDPGTCSADVPTVYTTAPPVTTTSVAADPNVTCSYHEQEPGQGIGEPYCVCTSGQSTETAPLISIASPMIYSQKCEYSTWPGTTTSISTDLPPPTTNTRACMVCTPYAVNGDNCNTIPNCIPQVAVATVTVGSAPVHTTTSTQCTETGQVKIGGIPCVDPEEFLDVRSLVVEVPTSGYNVTSLRDAMIASIALSIQVSATGSNCFKITYNVEQLKRRDGLLGWVDGVLRIPRRALSFGAIEYLNPRDRPFETKETMTMCNGAYFHTGDYSDPYRRTGPEPGPSDFMNTLFTFQASNSDNFLCEFLDMLVDGLTLLAPEFAVEDVELEEGIDALCCLADGGCQLGG
ncbi:uncharacterized protein PAC_04805 [Phialocephala subalpina]|uniref:Uncharacterized protein n=1 Tax=Phialocephala subalpina TaxID=576137 RepID=A0A1L7WQ66_9HELO|nr:uncharacterized protein PAC_04805 [Phialocephala subalpina]